MNIKDLFFSKKGQICSVTYERPVKLKKSAGDVVVTKQVSNLLCRAGIEYDNQKAVIEKRETGELPAVNAGLSWGEWEQYPYTITHKGERYFRFSTLNTPKSAAEVKYFLHETADGITVKHPIAVEDVKMMALASEFSDKEGLDVFTLREGYITDLK